MPAAEARQPILRVDGSLPHALSGRFLGLEPSPSADPTIHSLVLHAGTARAYRHRPITMRAPSGATATNLIEFAGRTLALADGAVAHELTPDLEASPVDVAGHHLGVGAHPKTDPLTGELHLLSSPGGFDALHHVIPAGAMSRRTRAITSPPTPVVDLAITTHRLVLVADRSTGMADRSRDAPIAWVPTGRMRPGSTITAHDEGGDVIVHLVGEGLERWTITPAGGRWRRQVLDATRQRPARLNESFTSSPHRYLYAIGGDRGTSFAGETLFKHDILAGTREDHVFGHGRRAGDFAYASDPERQPLEDGGWLLGLVHDEREGRTTLRVLDAADPAGPVLATVRLPRRIPHSLRCLWIPSPPRQYSTKGRP